MRGWAATLIMRRLPASGTRTAKSLGSAAPIGIRSSSASPKSAALPPITRWPRSSVALFPSRAGKGRTKPQHAALEADFDQRRPARGQIAFRDCGKAHLQVSLSHRFHGKETAVVLHG